MSYLKGDDMLFSIGGGALGSCDSHEITYDTETKEVAVKPDAKEPQQEGLTKETIVVGTSISISFSGLMLAGKTPESQAATYDKILAAWKGGQPVDGAAFHRGGEATPYLKGKFIITNLKEGHKSGDFSTYNGTLKITGKPETLDTSKFLAAGAEA